MFKRIFILVISLFVFTNCDVVVGNNPISKIIDFNPKKGRVGDIITIEVDMAYTQEEINNAINGIYNYDLERNIYLISFGGKYLNGDILKNNATYVTEYIEAAKQKIVCKVPSGAKTGYISITSGMDIDGILDGSSSKEIFLVVDASGDEIW
ncbi:MAG: hypothetical protein KA885_02795 [Spirochaetes bacterium]|nr:hypothetical protein [Spirochaetota bacterium]